MIAATDDQETCAHTMCCCSFVAKANKKEAIPAAIICRAALTVVVASTGWYLENKEPIAQHIEPPINIKKLTSFILLPVILTEPLPPNNISTPTKPISNPTIIILLEKYTFHSRLSRATNQSGTVDTIIAVNPLDKYCSAHITAPVPTNNIMQPPKAIFKTALNGGVFCPCNRHQKYKIKPATVKRIPAIIKGGKLLMANKLPR